MKSELTVKLRLFASVREICGFTERDILLDEGSTCRDAFNKLASEYPELNKLDSILVAKNETYCQWGDLLVNNDELTFFPPVNGG